VLLIQHTLDSYHSGIEVIGVNLQDVAVPEQVAPSQKDAIKAREDKDRLRVEAETYSNDILPKARGTAERQLLDAEACSAADRGRSGGRGFALRASVRLLRERRRRVDCGKAPVRRSDGRRAGQRNGDYVDAKGNGSNFYLPLDKLLEKHAPEHETGTDTAGCDRVAESCSGARAGIG
jgi:membrane protease subunit HflK